MSWELTQSLLFLNERVYLGTVLLNLGMLLPTAIKYVGFLQQHDPCSVAEDLLTLPSVPPSPAAGEELSVVARHQQRAALVFGWMHYVSDAQTGELIAPHGYYTDGAWVWPAYLLHYLSTRLPEHAPPRGALRRVCGTCPPQSVRFRIENSPGGD